MSTITIRILATDTTETLPVSTPAMGRARFERAYRSHRGTGVGVPAEVHTAALWAGPADAAAHERFLDEVGDDASTLETAGAEGYVLLVGTGDGCDVWAR